MKLQAIRDALHKKGAYNTTKKQLLCNWLATGGQMRLQFGLTLMPKKVLYKHTAKGEQYRHLSRQELDAAVQRFMALLSRVCYKQAYKRYGKKIRSVYVLEGERDVKDLHAHLALEICDYMDAVQFKHSVAKALELSGEFLIYNETYNENRHDRRDKYRYRLDAVDSGWITYITKELGRNDTDNVLFY